MHGRITECDLPPILVVAHSTIVSSALVRVEDHLSVFMCMNQAKVAKNLSSNTVTAVETPFGDFMGVLFDSGPKACSPSPYKHRMVHNAVQWSDPDNESVSVLRASF